MALVSRILILMTNSNLEIGQTVSYRGRHAGELCTWHVVIVGFTKSRVTVKDESGHKYHVKPESLTK